MKQINNLILACFLVLLVAAPAESSDEPAASLWARATPPGSTSAAIYGEFSSNSAEPISLEKIDLAGARHVMIHRTVEENGMMRMKHASLKLADGEPVSLQPGGLHIMVMGLSEPLKQGCSVTVQLEWSDGTITRHEVNVGSYGQQSMPETESVPCS